MNSNGTNILETLTSCVFSFKLRTPHSFGSLTTASVNHVQTPFRPPPLWPKIHQPSVWTDPEMLYDANLQDTVVDAPQSITTCTSSISSPAQSQHIIKATETDSFWSKYSQNVLKDITRHHERLEFGGCGLENFGNSCYVNSALQCLCHIRPFTDIILKLQQQQQQLPPVTSAYAQLLTEMQSIPKGSTSAHELKARISNINRRFAGTDQQDSHEFLTILLEALHDELMDNYQNSSIGDLMHGIIKSTVQCLACEEKISIDDSFLSLPLPVERTNIPIFSSDTTENIFWQSIDFVGSFFGKNVTLYDCFKDFLSIEQLGENGKWFCEKCGNLTDATKTFQLWQLPRVLIVQLKRFTCDLTNDTKITKKILFDLHLDLSEFINKCEHDPAPLYNLVAVLTHSGTLASGHYTTFAKHLDNCCWYHFDDQNVRQTPWYDISTSDAYVLVYERQHSHSSS